MAGPLWAENWWKVEERKAAGQWKTERERERDLENIGEGWRDGCKVRTLRKDK